MSENIRLWLAIKVPLKPFGPALPVWKKKKVFYFSRKRKKQMCLIFIDHLL